MVIAIVSQQFHGLQHYNRTDYIESNTMLVFSVLTFIAEVTTLVS